jgi:hypothetical protein
MTPEHPELREAARRVAPVFARLLAEREQAEREQERAAS